MIELLEAALRYASVGWHVFPIDPASKMPATAHGHHDATTDEAIIRQWWTANPSYSIAVWLRRSGLVAVDVDPRNGGTDTMHGLYAQHGALPMTCVQATRSGGQHIIMRDPSGDPIDRGPVLFGKLGPGIDLKHNGYVLVEPSPGYTWTSLDLNALADVPPNWLGAMKKSPAALDAAAVEAIEQWSTSTHALTEAEVEAMHRELADLGPRASGKGTTKAAIEIVCHRYGQSVADGAKHIEWWNAQNGKPMTGHELARQVERVARLERTDSRGIALAGSGFSQLLARVVTGSVVAATLALGTIAAAEPGTFAAALQDARIDVGGALAVAAMHTEPTPLFVTSKSLHAKEYGPTPWLVEGLITEGAVTMIGGEPKVSKTWTATEIAVGLATGTPIFGEFKTSLPKRVAYFYAEDLDRQVRNRQRALCAVRGVDPVTGLDNLLVQPRGRFLDITRDDDMVTIVASCRFSGGVDVLILEPLRDLHSGEEDASDAMRNVMRRLRVLAELLKCTVIVCHHMKKPSGSDNSRPGHRLRGSSAIHGALDCAVYLTDLTGDGKREYTTSVESEVKGARSAGRFTLTLLIDDDIGGEAVKATWKITRSSGADGGGDTRKEDEQDRLTLVIAQRSGGTLIWKDLRAQITGMNQQAKDAARSRLLSKGLIEERTEYDAQMKKRAVVVVTAKGQEILSTPRA